MKDPDEKIEVLYSCDCGLVDRPVLVSARRKEDVLVWMRVLQHTLTADHVRVSPGCATEYFSMVKIPMQSDAPVGGAAKVN